ncbi:MAG: M18 family aminopeptidase, partial [Microbacteriaceae bacterium]|nr:M18 family aminopeptidase [Microbacteriaceae bacterium]
DARTPVGIVAAHTDSPGFRLKPVAHRGLEGWCSVNAEVYGGPLLNSWLDRDLRVAGRLSLAGGRSALAATGAIARIPQLAVHLDRQVNAEGLKLDRQKHTRAVLGLEGAPGLDGGALALLAEAAGVDPDEVLGVDAFLADAQPAARLGADGGLIASSRLDNLISVHAGLGALLAAEPRGVVPVLAAFDHEEVGSATRSGAGGPLLEEVLDRIRAGLGGDAGDRMRAHAASWIVSSDVGHAVHPNYPERHDDDVRPLAGRGPIVKINADQRYTTDGAGEALWRECSARAGAEVQAFVSTNTIPCGSTVGPIMATRLGLRTVDVGVPILSMHSARELAALDDIVALEAVVREFLSTAH